MSARRRIGTLCCVLGILLMGAALALVLWNRWEDDQAGSGAQAAMRALEARDALAEVDAVGEEDASTLPNPYDPTMASVEIDGYDYVGYLMFPTLGDLRLPVMSDLSDAQLRIAPCRYTGSTKTDNLVVAAHNYRTHFGNLKHLEQGEPVYFEDMDGVLWRYRVVESCVLEPTAVEEMTSGEFDLTLFTCTYGGASRVTIRCDRV